MISCVVQKTAKAANNSYILSHAVHWRIFRLDSIFDYEIEKKIVETQKQKKKKKKYIETPLRKWLKYW